MKGEIWSKVPLLLVAGVASALVASFAIQALTKGSGTLCRNKNWDEVQLLGEELSKMCRQDAGQSRLRYDFEDCVSSIEFKRLKAGVGKEKGPMGIVVNYSGSWQARPKETECDEFRLSAQDFSGLHNLSLPGGHSYIIIVSAVDEEQDEKRAQINITNFALGGN